MKNKLIRSQNAHVKLRQKSYDVPGNKGDILFYYHNEVLNIQKKQNRVISKSERRKVYRGIAKHINNQKK